VGRQRIQRTQPRADGLGPGARSEEVGHGGELVAATGYEGGGRQRGAGVVAHRAPAQ
jgi:hypothetical protein